jgi:hypothetical protein
MRPKFGELQNIPDIIDQTSGEECYVGTSRQYYVKPGIYSIGRRGKQVPGSVNGFPVFEKDKNIHREFEKIRRV